MHEKLNIIYHISSLYSTTWVSWLLFALLILLMLNQSKSMNVALVLRNVFSRSERSYAIRTGSWFSGIISKVYGLGVVGLTMYIWGLQGDSINFIGYMQVLGITTLVYFLQLLVMYGVGYVFLSPKKMTNTLEQYNGIRTLVPLLLHPLLLIVVNYHNTVLFKVMCCAIWMLFVGLLFSKSVLLFYKNVYTILYIFLYIVFLEFMPIAIIMLWAHKL